MSLAPKLIEATQEIFSSMLMLEVTPGPASNAPHGPFRRSVTAMVGLAGSTKGLVAIHLGYEEAKAVTGSFLGMEVEEVDEDVRDAIGELANMLGGSIKSVLDEGGSEIKLSIPSAISGEEYTIDNLTDAQVDVVCFNLPEGGQFRVELQLEIPAE